MNFVIESGANVKLLAGNAIYLKPGFHATSGSTFHVYIEECSNYSVNTQHGQKSFGSNNEFYPESKDVATDLAERRVIAYPNPTKDIVNLKIFDKEKEDNLVLSVYSIDNKLILKKEIMNTNVEVDMTPFGSGIYFFKIESNEYSDFLKIIKH